ncbi:hypothetical protein IU450_28415 [Nocardia abscessus]|uniref:hypothetical protein n=1 Tax=Nocardia abscessus TaxID=120957 RepID=UPI001895EF9A|nr:hypothetical protein [Nocardia abscessus]MBF6339784.1 hypothetical protein [Nocardia abscessus]
MQEYAAYFSFGPGQVVIEPTAPELVLRAMLEEADRRNPAAAIMWRLEQVAQSWNVDLTRVFDADAPRTQLLWQVMEEIEGYGGSHLIVPSRTHLTSLGPSGKAVIQRLTRMPRAHIHVLDASTSLPESGQPEGSAPEGVSRRGERVLVESPVGAIPTVTRFDMVAELTRRGWPQVMNAVDALYVALVDDANAAAKAAGEPGFGPGGQDGVIRLIQRDDGLLVVELAESRHRIEDPVAALTMLCTHTERFTDRGHTITRCTLSSENSPPVAVPAECSGGQL